jgi:predicted MPP superfamily phosphohydrolase
MNGRRTDDSRRKMEDTLLHRLLVATNRWQELPTWYVAASLVFDALLVGLVWAGRGIEYGAIVGGFTLAAGFAAWEVLRELPRAGLSFGPDKPSALALGALMALILAGLGVLHAPIWLAGLAGAAIVGLTFYATHIEPFRLGVTEQALDVDGWRGEVKLLHIGDLHVERVTEREGRLNALIDAIQPDLIVFSGDFVNLSYTHDEAAKAAIRAVIGAWRAPLGVYAVPGTPLVEPLTRVLAFVEETGVDLLANRWRTVETPAGALHLLGLITTHDLPTDRAALADKLRAAPDAPGLRLLLTHSPDVAPEAAQSGKIDLYLCGHTHGGQIRLPLIGAIFSSSQLGRRFIMGRCHLDGMTLYTTRGVGMEGLGAPRARLFCPPEIVLWTLRGR